MFHLVLLLIKVVALLQSAESNMQYAFQAQILWILANFYQSADSTEGFSLLQWLRYKFLN